MQSISFTDIPLDLIFSRSAALGVATLALVLALWNARIIAGRCA